MFKLLRNNKGQGVAVQYVLTFFLVTATVASMSVYIRRLVQGRIRDARRYMALTVNATLSNASLNILGRDAARYSYEPYYMNVENRRFVDNIKTDEHFGGLSDVVFQSDLDYTTSMRVNSFQASPRAGD
ncbi:MAG: hypothetical protein KAJ18_06345 [Candidatus Omnitrophica bacterium]|nr:hypothetical protein [Candidatus Omnitrophota bacterium]